MNNSTSDGPGPLMETGGSHSWLLLCYLPVSTFLLWKVWAQMVSPLSKCPGPFLASMYVNLVHCNSSANQARLSGYTNLWRLYHVSRGSIHLVYQRLHEKYGPIVRVGPNVLDVVIPELVKPAFSDIKTEWEKASHNETALFAVDG